jgi:hypothetical protein
MDGVTGEVRRTHPKYVVLEARWDEYDWQDVGRTITAIKSAGVPQVIVVGPVPAWKTDLPQQLWSYMVRHPLVPVPVRMSFGLMPEPVRIDPLLRAIAEKSGATYRLGLRYPALRRWLPCPGRRHRRLADRLRLRSPDGEGLDLRRVPFSTA